MDFKIHKGYLYNNYIIKFPPSYNAKKHKYAKYMKCKDNILYTDIFDILSNKDYIKDADIEEFNNEWYKDDIVFNFCKFTGTCSYGKLNITYADTNTCTIINGCIDLQIKKDNISCNEILWDFCRTKHVVDLIIDASKYIHKLFKNDKVVFLDYNYMFVPNKHLLKNHNNFHMLS